MVQPIQLTLLILTIVVAQVSAAPGETKQTIQRISFRTIKPMSAHFTSEQDLEATEKTLKQLGCETKRAQHDGHIDLTYESKFWRSLSLKEQTEVAKWNRWLTSKGFAVVHNTPHKDHPETVQYRLPDWKTMHFHQPLAAKAHLEMFKMLGCEVKTTKHGDHEDLRVRCPAWQVIGVPNHAEAHAWMGVLKKLGFATLHEH